MRIALDLLSPWARILEWAALPLGLEVERVPPDADLSGYDLLLRFSPEVFEGDERAHPGRRAIEAYADLLIQKRLFRALGIPTPPFGRVTNPAEWEAMVRVNGLPAWLKDRKGRRAERVDAPGFEPPPGSFLYERALPFEAELLLLAVRDARGGVHLGPAARREGKAWRAPAPLPEKADRHLAHLLGALSHTGGLEVRAGLLGGEVYFLDFAPFPTARSLYLPAFPEAHLRAVLGHAVPELLLSRPAALFAASSREAALRFPYAHPFVLDRPYVRVEAADEGTLLERIRALQESASQSESTKE